MFWPLLAAATVAPSACYSYAEPPSAPSERPDSRPPSGDALGDAWEMEEVACWRGTWLRRGKTNIFDGYWVHPYGERVRATLQAWLDGRNVIMVRKHPGGQYCRYDGVIDASWHHVEGRYTCTWAREPMRWTAEIVHLPERLPALLRQPGDLPLPPS